MNLTSDTRASLRRLIDCMWPCCHGSCQLPGRLPSPLLQNDAGTVVLAQSDGPRAAAELHPVLSIYMTTAHSQAHLHVSIQ